MEKFSNFWVIGQDLPAGAAPMPWLPFYFTAVKATDKVTGKVFENTDIAIAFTKEDLAKSQFEKLTKDPSQSSTNWWLKRVKASELRSVLLKMEEMLKASGEKNALGIDYSGSLTTGLGIGGDYYTILLPSQIEVDASESPEAKKEGCFIATATYGDYSHPQVIIFRSFRDIFLSRSTFGRIFVETYYKISPNVMVIIERSPLIRKASRSFLNLFANWIVKRFLIDHKG